MTKSSFRRTQLLSLVFLVSLPLRVAAEDIILRANFLLSSDEAFMFVGLDKGFYSAEGLNVKVLRGFGSGDTVKRVGAAGEHFGVADPMIVVKGRGEGALVKAIGVIVEEIPSTYYALKSSGIRTVKDLEGKRLGDSSASVGGLLLPVFCRKAGLDCAKIQFLDMRPEVKRTALLARRIDFSHDYWYSGIIAMRQAVRAENDDLVLFKHSDYYRAYGSTFITTEQRIKENPDLVRRFLRATYKAIDYTIKNPDEAVKILFKRLPEANKQTSKEELLAFNDAIMSPAVREKGYGVVNRQKMKETTDIAVEIFKLKGEIKADDIYTNEFLPGLKP